MTARRFGAGKNDERRIARNGFPGQHHHEIDVGFELERIEIVEIRDP